MLQMFEEKQEKQEKQENERKQRKQRKQSGQVCRWPRVMWLTMWTAMWMGLLLWSSTGIVILAQSSGGSIPGSLDCEGDCPGVGTSETGWRQLVSPVTNACTGTALQLILQRLEIEVFLEPNLCPIWVIIEPAHRVPTAVAGCCLLSQQQLPVMRQALRCQCTRRFIICWDHDCLPEGEAMQISEQVSWVASPCAGGSSTEPCNQRRN